MFSASACKSANQEEAAEEGPVVMEWVEKVTVVTIEKAAEEGPMVMAEQVTIIPMEEFVEEGLMGIEEAEKVTGVWWLISLLSNEERHTYHTSQSYT